MANNLSKNFRDDQIKGILEVDGRRTLYLKEGVRKKSYGDHLDDTQMDHINHVLIYFERYEELMKLLYGGDDFEDLD